MTDLHLYLGSLREVVALLEAGYRREATAILAGILAELPEPPRWLAADQPPSDFGAWHWVWLAHSALNGEGVVPAEEALRTAIRLLGGEA